MKDQLLSELAASLLTRRDSAGLGTHELTPPRRRLGKAWVGGSEWARGTNRRMKNTGKQTLQRKAKPCSNLGLEEKRLKTDDEECEQCRPGSRAQDLGFSSPPTPGSAVAGGTEAGPEALRVTYR